MIKQTIRTPRKSSKTNARGFRRTKDRSDRILSDLIRLSIEIMKVTMQSSKLDEANTQEITGSLCRGRWKLQVKI